MTTYKILGSYLNLTPVFKVIDAGSSSDPWCRVSGATRSGNDWLFPAYYPLGFVVYRDLRILVPQAEWDVSTVSHLKALQDSEIVWKTAYEAYVGGKEVPMPPGLDYASDFEPYRHQRLGITMAMTWWRAFFLWEMGTGKTRTIIDGFRLSRRERPELKRMLVLTPPVVIPTWISEIEKTSQGSLVSSVWDGTDKEVEKAQKADIIVLSYARARIEFDPKNENPKRLHELDYQVIVADESHSIGNYESAQTQAALILSAKATRRYLLSGTSADHPGKLYPQFRFLSPGLMPMNWTQFRDTYYVYSQYRRGQVFGYKHLDDLNSRVDGIASRMKKSECLDLPPVTFVDVPFNLTRAQVDEYDACIARLKDQELYQKLMEGKGVSTAHGGALVNKLLQIVSGFVINGVDPLVCDGCIYLHDCVDKHIKPYTEVCEIVKEKPPSSIRHFQNPKLEVFKELLENILTDDYTNKVIVWATYIEELNNLQSVVEEFGYEFVRVDGSTTHRIKELNEKFQKDPNCRVYIGQVSSGIGVNLTAASYVIYYSLTWNLTSYKQSLERNNRPGQTRNMVVYRLLSTHPVALDRFLASMLQFKNNVAYTMLERITCSTCDHIAACAKAEIHPFRTSCKYAANVDKPTATAEYLQTRNEL